MKGNKKKVILIVFMLLLAIVAWKPTVIYRIPISAPQFLKAEIKYQMIDLGFDDAVRNYLEYRNGNVRVYLNDDKIEWLYVDTNDRKKLWPESPFIMKEKNYTIVAKFKVSKALIGNFTLAKIVDTVHIAGSPIIRK